MQTASLKEQGVNSFNEFFSFTTRLNSTPYLPAVECTSHSSKEKRQRGVYTYNAGPILTSSNRSSPSSGFGWTTGRGKDRRWDRAGIGSFNATLLYYDYGSGRPCVKWAIPRAIWKFVPRYDTNEWTPSNGCSPSSNQAEPSYLGFSALVS